MRRRGLTALAAAGALGLLGGCGGGKATRTTPSSTRAATPPRAPHHRARRRPLTVPVVFNRVGGLLPLVSVRIHGHRVRMVLDTGAGLTIIDTAAAKRLGLTSAGPAAGVRGAGCSAASQPVRIDRWSLGGRALPVVSGLSTVSSISRALHASDVVGQLGGDVLAKLGGLRLDYRRRTVAFGRPAAGAHAVRGTVVRGENTWVVSRFRRGTIRVPLAVDTGAGSSIVSARLAQRTGSPTVGKPATVTGVCGTATIREVRLTGVRGGSAQLPAVTAAIQPPTITGSEGLLGNDVLSTFGTLRVDYRSGSVTLG